MIYAGFLLTCLIGLLLLPPRWGAGLFCRLCFGFGAGMFAVSLQMFVYSLVGMPWKAATLLLPWAAAAALYIWRNFPAVQRPVYRRPSWPALLAAAGVLLPIAVWLPYERLMPLTSQSWDAWAIWLFKAKAFYLDGNIQTFLSRVGEFTTQPGYPLLVPLYATFLYVLNGEVLAQGAKLLSPCSYLALLGVFYYFSRRISSNLSAAAFTWMLATAPVVTLVAFELAGYADTTLSLYLLAAGGFLGCWILEQRDGDLVGASLAATAAAWTKNEGQFFLLAVVLVAGAHLLRGNWSVKRWAILVGPAVLVLAPWFLLRQAYEVEAAGFTLGVSFQPELFRMALRTLLAKGFQPGLFNLSFPLVLAAVIAAKPLGAPRAFWVVPGLILWHLSGALLAYATGRNEIQWWLGTSADRILAQIVPLALLAPAWIFGLWFEKGREQAASGAKPSTPPASKIRKRKRERTPSS